MTEVKTYEQDRPRDWLKENPNERWRCDIFPANGTSFHGTGRSEAEAMHNATMAYLEYSRFYTHLDTP